MKKKKKISEDFKKEENEGQAEEPVDRKKAEEEPIDRKKVAKTVRL